MSQQTSIVVMVCRGNVARSPFAAAVVKQELKRRHLDGSLEVLSRGIQGSQVDPEPVKYPNITYYREKYRPLRKLFAELQIDLRDHQATTIDQATADSASILLAMDGKTADALRSLFPGQAEKIHLFSELGELARAIPDPEFVSSSDSVQVFLDIRSLITTGFPRLLNMVKEAQHTLH